MSHSYNIVIGYGAKIGSNVTICNGVTLGAKTLLKYDTIKDKSSRYLTIENGVILFSGAKIIGPVVIGKNSIVAANAVVNHSFPPHSIIGGFPARQIGSVEEESITSTLQDDR